MLLSQVSTDVPNNEVATLETWKLAEQPLFDAVLLQLPLVRGSIFTSALTQPVSLLIAAVIAVALLLVMSPVAYRDLQHYEADR